MPGTDLVMYGTTGPSGTTPGDSQSDRTQWLGRFRASEQLREFESTLTASQTSESRHIVVDSSRIGDGADAHALKWLLIHNGVSALSAARIMFFDDATGQFKLDRPLEAGLAASGDTYAVFDQGNVWPDVVGQEAAEGGQRFRCIFVNNETGVTMTNLRVYVRTIGQTGAVLARTSQVNANQPFLQTPDGATDIIAAIGPTPGIGPFDPGIGSYEFSGSSGWSARFGYGTASDNNVVTLVNGAGIAIWMRRTIQSQSRLRRSVALMVIVETDFGGDDPDPLRTAAIMPFDIAPSPAEVVLTEDRFLSVGGGERLVGTITADGFPVIGRPVRWDVRPGDLGTIFTDDIPLANYDTSDDDGSVEATLISPDSQAAAGVTTHPQLIVGAGEEVGNP